MGFNIAIDGPAGAGKSTIAKEAAKRMQFIYVDTGAMYRSIGLYMERSGIDAQNKEDVEAAVAGADVRIVYQDGVQQVLLNGENVSNLIRTEKISLLASKVSAYPKVRAHLLALQRQLAEQADVLMDGRDIGTCILPNAELKIYLTASADVRAKRRFEEQQKKGEDCSLEEIKAKIIERDKQDMNRETAPLKQAEDAVVLDTSDMTIEEAVEKILTWTKERKKA